MHDAPRKVNRPTITHLRPSTFHKIANAPLDNEEQLILVPVHMGWGTTAGRRDVKHHGKRAAGLVSGKHHGNDMPEGMEVLARAGLDDKRLWLLVHGGPFRQPYDLPTFRVGAKKRVAA